MKTGAVNIKEILKKECDLRGHVYLDPTLTVDQQIAWAEKTIKNAQVRLAMLKKRREAILRGEER